LSGLPTAAPAYANLILLLELVMGVGLLAGGLLARLKRFREHAWCQSVIVLVNLSLIVLTMLPSFRVHVAPRIPLKLGKAYYAVATAHAALGTLAEGGGLYILLAAGTSLLPPRLRIRNYKLWMRTVLVLWWVVLLLGTATYARWYVPHIFRK
jgi:Ca2+/H+ antiporter